MELCNFGSLKQRFILNIVFKFIINHSIGRFKLENKQFWCPKVNVR
nr:MAG TPA: hypothetical protein [Caudoviricetes sp.]